MSLNNYYLPKGVELEALLKVLRHLSWGAADILLAYARGEQPPYGFPKALSIESGGEGPVSAADLAVNAWLIDGFHSSFSEIDWQLLSEETAKDQLANNLPIDSKWLWILDPLDGTKDFLEGSKDYAVHLGLIKDNQPVLGVVLLPEAEELWFGIVGKDCWYENRMGKRSEVCFSNRNKNNELVLVASKNHRDQKLEEFLEKLEFIETKKKGSVGCKVASILRGEADVYISLSGKSSPKDWDMAAPEALLNSAGGKFTHADGRRLKYNSISSEQRGCLIATHGKCHDSFCSKAIKALKTVDPNYSV